MKSRHCKKNNMIFFYIDPSTYQSWSLVYEKSVEILGSNGGSKDVDIGTV